MERKREATDRFGLGFIGDALKPVFAHGVILRMGKLVVIETREHLAPGEKDEFGKRMERKTRNRKPAGYIVVHTMESATEIEERLNNPDKNVATSAPR